MRKPFVVLAAFMTMMLTAGLASAVTYNYTLAGASPGGLWSALGAGINSAIKAAYPGSTITYQTSGGGIANVGLVQLKKVELGIIHNAELKIAGEGGKPFAGPVKNLRAIANLYNWAPMHVFVTKDFADKYGIKSFDDLVTKKAPARILVNKRGNIAAAVAEQMFKALGTSFGDVNKWGGRIIYAASKEQGDLIKNRRADVIINSLFVGHGSLRELEQSVDVVILPLSKRVIETVNRLAGTDPFTIPAGSYKLQKGAVESVTLSAELVASDKMDNQTAYNLTKALVEHIDKIQGVHKAMKALTPQIMVNQKVIPFHPGAERYYKEIGLIK